MVAIIPGADMPIMTLNQAKMLLQIAAAYDKALGKERLKELAAIVGGGFAFRAIARQLVALAPGWGWIIKGGIGFTGTASMGYAAIAYFEQLVGEGSTVEDAVAAARAEAARVQAAMSSEETPTDAALAAVRTVAGDVAEGAVSAAKNIVPAVRVAAVEARDNIDINPKDLGKHLLGAISSLNKGQ